jgi:hypothetical protein
VSDASRGRQLSESRASILDGIFTAAQPLGPPSLDDVRSRAEARILFDGDNEVDRVITRASPVFLVGRRGSGKTAFLKASTAAGELSADVNTAELISQVGKTIAALGVEFTGDFTERVVPIWEACFIAALCSRIWSDHCRLSPSDCPQAFDFGEHKRKSVDGRATDVASRYLLNVRRTVERDPDFASVRTLLDEVELNGVPLHAARESIEAAAAKANCHALISMDSLDRYQGVFYRNGALFTDASLALQGLFRAASRLGRSPNSFFRVRVSFPAELWHYYSTISANPLKDFDNCVLLHWENKELLHITATRFLKYLRQVFPAEYRRMAVGGSGDRYAQDIFETYLPQVIINRMGHEELTLPYILRHTQLLPRHLISIMNLIFADYELTTNKKIDAEHIRNAVGVAEVNVVNSIIGSYEIIYPELRSVCEETIRYLPFRFNERFFHRVVNQHKKHGVPYEDVVQMLVEAGAIGRYVDSTDRYDKADFEYLHPHRLFISDEDELCLHPLFARTFSSPGTDPLRADRAQKPILPLGSDPSAQREFRRYVHMTQYPD